MRMLFALSAGCWLLFVVYAVRAVIEERRMQQHRKPGVSYWQVTMRKDGAWKRGDLFDEPGLMHQRRASRFGLIALVFAVAGLLSFVAMRVVGYTFAQTLLL